MFPPLDVSWYLGHKIFCREEAGPVYTDRPGIAVGAVDGTAADTAAVDAAAVVIVSVAWVLVVARKACVRERATGRLLPGMSLLLQWLACSPSINGIRPCDGAGGWLDGRRRWSVYGVGCRRTLCVTVRGSSRVYEQLGGRVYFDYTLSVTVSVGGHVLVPGSGGFL